MMRIAVCLLLSVLLAANIAFAAKPYTLIEPYVYGTPRAELENLPGAQKGQDKFVNDVILPEMMFAGLPWTVRLVFEENKLTRVSLMEAYSKDRMSAVTKQLKADKLTMLGIRSDSVNLDVFAALRSSDVDSVRKKMRDIAAKTKNSMTYAWFDTTVIPEGMLKNARGLGELIMASPDTLRQAEVVLLADEKTHQPSVLVVDFLMPVLEVQ